MLIKFFIFCKFAYHTGLYNLPRLAKVSIGTMVLLVPSIQFKFPVLIPTFSRSFPAAVFAEFSRIFLYLVYLVYHGRYRSYLLNLRVPQVPRVIISFAVKVKCQHIRCPVMVIFCMMKKVVKNNHKYYVTGILEYSSINSAT